tara:strand:+ start:599 stop:787 length:189 start_codon:yes stop_codon:yes gene_type:complete
MNNNITCHPLEALDEITKAYQRLRSCTHTDDHSADKAMEALLDKVEEVVKLIHIDKEWKDCV